MSSDSEIIELASLFRALSDETRLRLVALLSHGELCVCHLVDALELPQSTVSRQLTVLRHANVVTARREGTWVHYGLAAQSSPACREQLSRLVDNFKKHTKDGAKVARLVRARGPALCR